MTIAQRLDQIEAKVDGIVGRLTRVEERLERLDVALTNHAITELAAIRQQITTLHSPLRLHDYATIYGLIITSAVWATLWLRTGQAPPNELTGLFVAVLAGCGVIKVMGTRKNGNGEK